MQPVQGNIILFKIVSKRALEKWTQIVLQECKLINTIGNINRAVLCSKMHKLTIWSTITPKSSPATSTASAVLLPSKCAL